MGIVAQVGEALRWSWFAGGGEGPNRLPTLEVAAFEDGRKPTPKQASKFSVDGRDYLLVQFKDVPPAVFSMSGKLALRHVYSGLQGNDSFFRD